jgi:hypothetical protein
MTGGFKNSHKSELGTVISFSEREFDRERVAGIEALDMDRAAVRQMDRQRAQTQPEVGWLDPGAEAQSVASRYAVRPSSAKSLMRSMPSPKPVM